MSRCLGCTMILSCLVMGGACDRSQSLSSSSTGEASTTRHATTEQRDQPLLDHPEYVHWKQFSVGAFAIRKKDVVNDHGVVHVTTQVRLVESNSERVVVETQIAVEHQGQSPVENPPLRAEFPARFRLPPGMKPEQFSLPSLKARLVGEERRAALGREFPSRVFQWDEINEAGPMKVRLWWSNEVPGRILRQEINGLEHQSVEEVVELVLPAS